MSDEYFIKKTLTLAKKGLSWTNPNPMVGAVIVKNGKVLAEGYHKKFGFPHAEIEGLNLLKNDADGATLYVNLEPCNHFGQTPPCTDAIISSGIKRVVCSTLDPNPKVAGKGVKKLKKAGIKVDIGILKEKAQNLNEAFFVFHKKKRPFIALKFASSIDGKLATTTGDSKWITNETARNYARGLRAKYQAILVGINTVLKDDPHLGIREFGKKDPIRIILDSKLKIPLKAQVLRDENIIIATTNFADKEKKELLKSMGILVLSFKGERIPIKALLKTLAQDNIISVLVEGGGQVLESFIEEKIVDKLYAFYAPIIIGEGKMLQDAIHLKNVSYKRVGDNLLTVGNYG